MYIVREKRAKNISILTLNVIYRKEDLAVAEISHPTGNLSLPIV